VSWQRGRPSLSATSTFSSTAFRFTLAMGSLSERRALRRAAFTSGGRRVLALLRSSRQAPSTSRWVTPLIPSLFIPPVYKGKE
jgi:hypothetical protein